MRLQSFGSHSREIERLLASYINNARDAKSRGRCGKILGKRHQRGAYLRWLLLSAIASAQRCSRCKRRSIVCGSSESINSSIKIWFASRCSDCAIRCNHWCNASRASCFVPQLTVPLITCSNTGGVEIAGSNPVGPTDTTLLCFATRFRSISCRKFKTSTRHRATGGQCLDRPATSVDITEAS